MTDRLVLREASSPVQVQLPVSVARALTSTAVCDVTPGDRADYWSLQNVRKVGVIRVADLEVVIQPKVPIRSLFWMMASADRLVDWRPDDVGALDGESITDALARAYARALGAATAGGLLREYRSDEQSAQVIRGRWDIARQIRNRQGVPLPAEITADEFDADSPTNRVLLAALVRLLRMPGLSSIAAARLRWLLPRFEDVGTLPAGVALPTWRSTRLNRHLAVAYRLATLALSRLGIEHAAGPAGGTAFLVTMATVFERFVEFEVRRAALSRDVRVLAQKDWPFDAAGRATMTPDLVLQRGGEPVAVLDAKYKQERASGYPNADLYQALAYASRLGLDRCFLVYARGLGEQIDYVLDRADVVVHCVTLDLEQRPAEVSAVIDLLVTTASH